MKKIFSLFVLLCSVLQATTYQDAGVDIDMAMELVEMIKPIVKETARSGTEAEIGGFGGLFDLSKVQYKDPILVGTTDGVGTKLLLTRVANQYDTIGIDLVAMCVNDLIAQGAEPLFFLDYYATGKVDLDVGPKLVGGIAQGCRIGRCALIGGETAEMPSLYQPGEYDLAGFAVGIVERDQLLPKIDDIGSGDVVIGLASSGLHSNGFSLVRKIIADHKIPLDIQAPFLSDHKTLADALLEPTKIYVDAVTPFCKRNMVKAIANITGGGLVENIPRVLPSNVKVKLKRNAWDTPPVFQWIKELGHISDREMERTFNLGIGIVMVVAASDAMSIVHELEEAGHRSWVIGLIEPRLEEEEQVYNCFR